MFTLLGSVVVTLMLWTVPVQAYTPPSGFRGIAWGTLASTLEADLVLVDDSPDVKYYTRLSEKYTLGEATLDRITYGFFRGRFYTALIQFHGLSNFQTISEALRQTFGPATQPNRYIDRFVWGLNTSVVILADKAGVIFQFGPIAQEERLAAQQKGKAAGKDL